MLFAVQAGIGAGSEGSRIDRAGYCRNLSMKINMKIGGNNVVLAKNSVPSILNEGVMVFGVPSTLSAIL